MWIILPAILTVFVVAAIGKKQSKKKGITKEEQEIIENVTIVQPIIRDK